MHAVHKQTKTLSLEASDSLDDKDRRVECDGPGYGLTMVRHRRTPLTDLNVINGSEVAQQSHFSSVDNLG